MQGVFSCGDAGKSPSIDMDLVDLHSTMGVSEIRESMASLHAEVSRLSNVMRSIVHDELEQFFQRLTEQRSAWQAPHIGSILTHRSVQLQEYHTIVEEDQPATISEHHDTPLSHSTLRTSQIPVQITQEHPIDSVQATRKRIRQAMAPTYLQPLLQDDMAETEKEEGKGGYRRHLTKSDRKNQTSHDDMSTSISLSARRHVVLPGHSDYQEEINDRLNKALKAGCYNVEDYYEKTGFWQAWARQNSWFSTVTLVVIAVNVIWIGVDTELDQGDVLCKAPILSQVVDNLFCLFFVFELFVRFMAFADKSRAFKDSMFLFDTFLVIFVVWETWIEVLLYLALDESNFGSLPSAQFFRFFRLFRLSRVPRIIRLSMSFPELLVLLKGMAAAMRSVFAILVLLLFVIFIFSVLFTQLLDHSENFQDSFSHVRQSMYKLLIDVLCGPDPDFILRLFEEGIVYWCLYMLFIFMGTLTLMNMLIGVLCDVVSGVSDQEKENVMMQELNNEISVLTRDMDLDGDGNISQREFEDMMKDQRALTSLDRLGVDVVAFGGLATFIFVDGQTLTLPEFRHLVAQFRGSRTTTVKDLVDTRRFITTELDAMLKKVNHNSHLLNTLAKRLLFQDVQAVTRNVFDDGFDQTPAPIPGGLSL